MTTSLEAALLVHRGTFTLDVSFAVAEGETLALLGPNGAGKSTLLSALSGLISPSAGTVTLAGRTLTRRRGAAEPGAKSSTVHIPPDRRRIGLLSQDPLLFPHLNALENVAFGQRVQGRPRQDAARDAAEWLDAVGLSSYARRRPAALSGGQQQRVAIARALAARPEVLLLDEPLAALDVQTAAQTRKLLADRITATGTTAIVVTHDVIDAVVLADRCAIMQDGRIVDDGPKARVLGRPANQFIAALAGLNLLAGVSDGADGVRLRDGRMLRGHVEEPAGLTHGQAVSAVFSPSAIRVRNSAAHDEKATQPAGANAWSATVSSLEPSAGGIRIRTREDADLIIDVPPARAMELDLSAGAGLSLSVPAAAISLSGR